MATTRKVDPLASGRVLVGREGGIAALELVRPRQCEGCHLVSGRPGFATASLEGQWRKLAPRRCGILCSLSDCEQRFHPPARQELFRSPATEPTFGSGGPVNSHQRSYSDGRGGDPRNARDQSPQRGSRRYFSELSGLEYFIIRHLAILTIHPMIESEFSFEELLGFIESRKQPTFWKNIGKAFQKDGRKNVKMSNNKIF